MASVDLVFNERFGQFAKQIKARLQTQVVDTANEIADAAQQRAPVDTGALRESIHVVSHDDNGYPDATATASNLRPEANLFDEVTPADEMEAVVAVAVEYGMYLEYGTVKQPAQPFFTPAYEQARQTYFDKVEQILNNP